MHIVVTAALIILVAHLVLGVILWLRVRKIYCYPGLLGFPVFGNLYYFYKTLLPSNMDYMVNTLDVMAKQHGKDGLCFCWTSGYKLTVLITSPHITKEIGFHPNLADKPAFMYGGSTPYIEGIFNSERADDLWKLKRKEYSIFLKKTSVDRDYFNTFIKCSDKMIDFMLASPSAADIHHATISLMLYTSLRTLFGNETSLISHPKNLKLILWMNNLITYIMVNPRLAALFLSIFRRVDGLFFPKGAELRTWILENSIKTVKSSKGPTPDKEKNLSLQITSRSLKCNNSINVLIKELQELFLISTHTLTGALASSIIFLAIQPDMQEKAWKEQHEIFGNDERDPTLEDMERMEFLDRFIKESLRFAGPSFLGKLATGDININGITIPEGAGVVFLIRCMRMDPEYWKNPKVFDPDRYLDEDETSKLCYAPFGVGVRACPANYFSTKLMKVTLSKILRRLKLRPVEENFRFEDIKFECAVMTEITNPPLLKIEERA
ncbi:unnamed protein product [Nezara viridula]|uniref:Cytochrome P450 n=1 Tax=Nezara viridula TaxID=85310 RepID=A0A9P0H0N7_NEZVI|nr:unnamed protein product [Nezara viridula]